MFLTLESTNNGTLSQFGLQVTHREQPLGHNYCFPFLTLLFLARLREQQEIFDSLDFFFHFPYLYNVNHHVGFIPSRKKCDPIFHCCVSGVNIPPLCSWFILSPNLTPNFFHRILLKILFIYFYREGQGGKRKGRETLMFERNIDRLPLTHTTARGRPPTNVP